MPIETESRQEDKMSLVIGLHPNPSQTPQQILHDLETEYSAENLDTDVETAANLVRIKLDRKYIAAVAKIDSVGTIDEVRCVVPFSILADSLIGINPLTPQSI